MQGIARSGEVKKKELKESLKKVCQKGIYNYLPLLW
jgi:hypothetical protein